MLKKIVFTLFVFAFCTSPVTADDFKSLDVTEEKLKLANKILEASPASKQLEVAIDGLEQRVPVTKRAQFRSIMNQSVDLDRLSSSAKLSMAEIFTEKELEVLYAYQASKEGQSIQKKLPVYQERLKPMIEEMLRKAMVQMQKNDIPFQ